MASVLDSSNEKTNNFKLMRLIVDGGTEALRQTFSKYHPGNLKVVLSKPKSNLFKLLGNIISQEQWDKLYPAPPNVPNINDFDISLLCILLRNVCGLKRHSDPIWKRMPNASDHTIEADVVRIRIFRNERFAHIPNTAVSDGDFKSFWAEISAPLVRLGIKKSDIDRLENELCGEVEVKRVMKEWEKSESKILNVLNEIKDDVKALRKDEESRSDELLNKHLVWCNFKREIELYYEKFTKGTRKWVFKEFSEWFDDESSKNRAFIISGLAGMGKSVIAAAICKKFVKHLAACHFFQYNNSKYNNPKIFLQSLAWQVSQVFPAYKKALINALSGKLAQSLDDMNVEGLFSTLFKEPLSDVDGPCEPILIVLDALDESESNKRDELVHLISNHLHKLPSYIRFVITTRPDLIDKFEKLNPLYIRGDDPRNLLDLKIVLQERISGTSVPRADLVDRLAKKSDGLMLYAVFLSEIYNEESSSFNINNLPNGIEEHYEHYFRRLKSQLGLLEISEDKFLSFLCALAVSKEPLPDAFLEILFEVENSPSKMKKVRKAISSLLIINENKSISFFHKSIRDWLVDHSEHDYTVDVQRGHKILFDICVSKLDELKVSGVTDLAKTSAAIKYSIKFWMLHMLNALKDSGKLEYSVTKYVADLEVMFASVCVNVDLILHNITDLTNHEMYHHVSQSTRVMVARLFFLIQRFSFLLTDYPHTFLQNVVNEGGDDLSLKASLLLQTRYKDIVYLEFVTKDRKSDPLEARCLLSGAISGIDISSNYDYVVCSYREGGIELFSTATFMSVWQKPDVVLEQPPPLSLPNFLGGPCMLRHCIVFHPGGDLILPGRLDEVLTIEGKLSSGPFQCDESCSKFTNCCFSSDNSRMVTSYGNDLIVWRVPNGKKEGCLLCNRLCLSFSFTTSGNFLGTVDVENVFNVYDMSNDNYPISKSLKLDSQFLVELLCTFEHNSWFCSLHQYVTTVDQNLNISHPHTSLTNIILPGSLHYCEELACLLQHSKQTWFSKVRKFLNRTFGWSSFDALRYILIGSKSVLVYSSGSNAMHMFSIKSLVDGEELDENMKGVFSNISLNGHFAYFNNLWARRLTICNLHSNEKFTKSFDSPSLLNIPVVREGVILYDQKRTPELWNCNMAQCLETFDALAGMKECFSVSDEVIACVFHSTVVFFNVFTGQIESKTDFSEHIREVKACSIRYHVLAQIESSEFSLWKNGIRVDGWEKIFQAHTSLICILFAEFSPEGSRVALFSAEINKIFIFDVVSLRYVSQVPIYGPNNDILRLKFFDNENLVCGSTNHILYFINVDRGEILTCLDIGNIPAPIGVCRKGNIVFVGLDCSENFELIKVCLRR